jgi:hypothetical protein
LNFQVQLRVLTRRFFWVNKSVTTVGKLLLDQVVIKPNSFAVFPYSWPFVAILQFLLLLFLFHFPKFCLPLLNRKLY